MKAYYYIGKSCVQIIQSAPNEAIVDELYVDPDERGNGIGRKLMRMVCRDADKENVDLLLRPHPFGSYDIPTETHHPPSLTYKQLCAFYRTFGFRFQSKPFNDVMKRTPK